MWGNDTAVYGLKYGGRCIVAQANPLNMATNDTKDNASSTTAAAAATATSPSTPATPTSASDSDSDSDLGMASLHYFLLGTTSLSESNEIHQVEYNEETSDLRCTAVYGHPDEIWHMAPNPMNSSLLSTIHTSGNPSHSGRKVGTLWRFPTEAPPIDLPLKVMPLEKVCAIPNNGDLTSSGSDTVDFAWDTHGAARCMSIARDGLRLMSLEGGALRVEGTILRSSSGTSNSSTTTSSTAFLTGFSKARWDPHHRNEIAAASGGSIFGYDLRQPTSSVPVHWIDNAHSQMVYDLDYNPNKPYCLMTCGDDCLIRFWDLRMATTATSTMAAGGTGTGTGTVAPAASSSAAAPPVCKPIAVLRNHTHWVRTSKYNPFHDQLVLSAGSDAAVDLWRISSISSAPLLDMDGEDDDDDDDDGSSGSGGSGGSGSDDGSDKSDTERGGESSSSGGGATSSRSKNRRSVETTLDTLITRFDEAHEESVYSVAWSVAEAWTFASMSHDGRMVVNTVPSAEKYKILL